MPEEASAPAGSDTIFGPATGRGAAGLAVVRLSGPRAWDAAAALGAMPLPPPRRAALRSLRDGGGELLDEALVLLFEPGASFTGEAVAELHLHGAPAIVSACLAVLAGLPGLRPAGPGEFTRRAFENGRIDLVQVEGLADLLAAETEAQRRQAMRVLRGALSGCAEAWRAGLVAARALVEAGIDFTEEDLPAGLAGEVRARIARIRAEMARERAGAAAAERIRDGFEVALVGRPNAGKSSLFNALARREVAITSPEPGTTRDVLELRLDLAGLPVTLLDMAGLRETGSAVEAIGVRRARERAMQADLRLLVLGPGDRPADIDLPLSPGDLVVRTKADLGPSGPLPAGALATSVVTGAGLDALVTAITGALQPRAAGSSAVIRERHRRALERAEEELAAAERAEAPEIVAEHLRAATRALESLVGRVDVEAILDDIFGRFCIGK